MLEELGVLSHLHGPDDPAVVAAVEAFDAQRGFAVDVSHLTMIGRCAACQAEAGAPG